MILTLISSVLGLFGSAMPDLIGIFKAKQDNKQELAILALQMKQQQQGQSARLDEINVKADISESRALYKTYTTGVTWVDALSGTVRPVLAYAFFLLYAGVKISQASLALQTGVGVAEVLPMIWTGEDQIIFAGIISFYFGQRAMQKTRQGK